MIKRAKQNVLVVLAVLLGALPGVADVDASDLVVRGSGRTAVQKREVGSFSGLALHVVGDVEIEIADQEALRVEAEENLLEYIETKVVDDVLVINQADRTRLKPSKPVRFHVTVRKLNQIIHAASGRIHVPRVTNERLRIQHTGSGQIHVAVLELETLSVHASGSGEVILDKTAAARCQLTQSGSGDVKVRRLVGLSNDVRLTGSGDVSVSGGSVVQQNVFVSGSGEYRGIGLQTSVTVVMASGSGSASVQASEQLDATITGEGDISYRGSPDVVQSVSGRGKLKKIP